MKGNKRIKSFISILLVLIMCLTPVLSIPVQAETTTGVVSSNARYLGLYASTNPSGPHAGPPKKFLGNWGASSNYITHLTFWKDTAGGYINQNGNYGGAFKFGQYLLKEYTDAGVANGTTATLPVEVTIPYHSGVMGTMSYFNTDADLTDFDHGQLKTAGLVLKGTVTGKYMSFGYVTVTGASLAIYTQSGVKLWKVDETQGTRSMINTLARFDSNPSSEYHNPIVTAHPDRTYTIGTTVGTNDWIDGITASWGKTMANTIPTMGAITDTSLTGGTDANLSTTGAVWDRVGWATHTYSVKDDHSLSTVAPYTKDHTEAITTRNIIVRSSTAPSVAVKYGAAAVDETGASKAGAAYSGEWTNQPLDITASSADPGSYDTSIRKDGAAMSPVQATTGNSHTISGYYDESPASGNAFSAILLGTGNHALELSPESTGQTVKIDKTAPTLSTVSPQQTSGGTDDWSQIPGTNAADALSGLETATGGLYYKFVSHGAGTPAIDGSWSSDYAATYGALSAGSYDLYIYAKDNAANKSGAILANTGGGILVLSHKAPVLTGSTASVTNLPTDTWTNEDVTVLAKNPSDVDTPPAVSSPHYVDYTDSGDTTTTPPITSHSDRATTTTGSVTHTYTEETDEIIVNGVLVNGSGTALTQPGNYKVKIDKTKPTAGGSFIVRPDNSIGIGNVGAHDNNPTSNGSTGSGIDNSSARFAIVPEGTLAPTAYASYTYTTGTVPPNTLAAGTYEIYSMIKDNAGNLSSPNKLAGTLTVKDDGVQPKLTGIVSAATSDKDGNAIAAGTGYTSGKWINKPVTLTGSKGSQTYVGDHNIDIVNGAGTTVASGTGNTGANTTYVVATEGKTSYKSVVVNTASKELSDYSTRVDVWIDTMPPGTNLTSADNWTTNVDASVDDTTMTPDVSGVYKSYVNFIRSGSAVPTYSTAGWTEATVASLTTAGSWDVYAYSVDHAGNRSAVAMIDTNINISSSVVPALTVTYSAGATDKNGVAIPAGTAYDNNWTNDAVDLKLQTAELATPKYGVLYAGGTAFVNGTMIGQQYVNGNYGTESTTNLGTDLTGRVSLDAGLTMLSPVSNTVNVKIDKTAPVTAITANAGNATFTDGSTDDKSGVYKTMVAYVGKGAAAPAAGAYAEISTINITTPGEYDIWAYTVDNAGNQSAAGKKLSGLQVVSTAQPDIKATYQDGGTQNYTSGTWVNKDVTITVSKPSGFTYTGPYNNAAYYNATALLGTGTDNQGGDYNYTTTTNVFDETVHGVLVDGSGNAISNNSGTIQVKVDKVAPNAASGVAPVTFEILDQSTDAHSGINSSATKIAIVPHGAATPAESSFTPLAGDTVPNDGNYYDVYMIAYDNAGNSSGVMQVLRNRSTNPKDDIRANDFERGLDQGTLTDADARGLSDVSGEYYDIAPPLIPITIGDIIVDAADMTTINGQITAGVLGSYDLQFSTPVTSPPRPASSANPAYSEQADIKVKLFDHGAGTAGTERIYANDFAYSVSGGNIDDARAKALASVFAREANLSVMNLSSVMVNQTELGDINTAITNGDVSSNPWPLTFTTPGGESAIVQVSLYDHVTPNPPTPGEEMIAANNFEFGMDQGALTDVIAKHLSNVTAKDDQGNAMALTSVTVDPIELAVINTAIAAGDKNGNPFDLTFSTPGGKSVTVKVTLKDHSNPPVVGTAYITGDDFRYAVTNGAISDVAARQLSQVSAKDALGVRINPTNIAVDPLELAAINAAITAKNFSTFPLTFTEPSGEHVTIDVTLYGNGPQNPNPKKEEIFANDFSYGISSGALTGAGAKLLSNVYAHYANGADVALADINVDTAELAAINARIAAKDKSGNPYPLTFHSPGGETVIVKVTLKDNGPTTPPTSGKEYITGNDFFFGMDQGALSDTNAKFLAQLDPRNINGSKMNLANVTTDPTELAAINTAITAGDKSGNPFDLTFRTPDGTSVTVKVTLVDHSNPGVTPGTAQIVGNDFAYGINQGALTGDMAKLYANAAAADGNGNPIPTANIAVDPTELNHINTKIAAGDKSGNPYPLTFTEPSGEQVTVLVTLKDQGTGPVTPGTNEERIAADNFFWGIDRGAITPANAKLLAKVLAAKADGTPIAAGSITVDTAQLAVINAAIAAGNKSGNPFALTFTSPAGKAVTIQVTLYDHMSPNLGNAVIVGDNFAYAISNGAMSDAAAKTLAKVAAKDALGKEINPVNITVDPTELGAINTAIAAGAVGSHPLTYMEPSGEWVTVTVTLYHNGPVPPTPGAEEIFANDFTYGISSGALNADGAKLLSHVYAHDASGMAIALTGITVDATELSAINTAIANKDKSGNPHPLTFTSPGGEAVTVQVTLKDNGPATPPASGKEYITGNDFSYGMDQGALSDVNAKFLAQLDPRHVDGSAMNLASVTTDAAELTAINNAIAAGNKNGNPFDLTFTTPDGTSVTVKVTLKDHINPAPTPGDAQITGNDFSYGIDQGILTDDMAKGYANAAATNANGDLVALANITADPIELAAINNAISAGQKGDYPLTFTEPSGKSVTVTVTLKDHGAGTVNPGNPTQNTDRIAANDFIYGINEGALTEAEAEFRSQVEAVDKDGNPYNLSEITIDAGQLADINTAISAGQTGDYPLTFYTPDGTGVTITVNLKDQAVAPTPDPSDPGKPSSGNIGANDFLVSANDPTPLSDQDARDLSRVQAKDQFGTDFPSGTIIVDPTELAAINAAKAAGTVGDYPLTFTSPEGKSVTVTVSLRATQNITLNYIDRQGNTIRATETELAVTGSTYTKSAPVIAEKVFVDWSKHTTNPLGNLEGNTTINIPSIHTDMTITLVYGQDKGGSGPDGKTPDGIEDFTVTERYVGNGATIAADTERYINKGTTYVGSPLSIAGYIYSGYQVDGGPMMRAAANPTIVNVQSEHAVTMHYAVKTSPGNPTNPPKPGDNGNYNFVKKPNVKSVAAGETVNYTFANFGNNWGTSLDKYAISDKPDKGLDFVSAKLPAFKNGTGVTYDVIYFTNLSGKRVLNKDVAADKAFVVKAPALKKGEYITAISFEFGTVPAGFAVGNTMSMTFRVWDNPPAKTLTNTGILTYKANGKDMEFISSGAGTSINISGWFDAPKTGDTDKLFGLYCAMALTLMVILLPAMRKKKQNSN